MIYIHHATLYTPTARLEDAAILIRDGVIERITTGESLAVPHGAQVIDAHGKIVAPGLIDLQLNGAFGDDFTANPETIWRVAEKLPRFGVTAFLPTLVTCPLEQIVAAQQVLRKRPNGFRGAEPLGLHLEGPFLNRQKKGAHNPLYLMEPDSTLVRDWSPANGVRMVTLAPELPNALGLVEELATQGIVVSMGHTMATADEAQAGYSAGIRYATHLFNAMPSLEHRNPNAPGAVLAQRDWVTGLIPDGIHVHPTMVKMVWNAKGTNVNLVSDAMAALGMPPGTYKLNDFECVVSEDTARLRNGTLAGSVLPLDQAVRNFMQYTGCTLSEALETVTTTPARVLGIENERGWVREGMVGDLMMLDEGLNVEMTVAGGQVVYAAGGNE